MMFFQFLSQVRTKNVQNGVHCAIVTEGASHGRVNRGSNGNTSNTYHGISVHRNTMIKRLKSLIDSMEIAIETVLQKEECLLVMIDNNQKGQ